MKKKGIKHYLSLVCTACAIVYLLLRIFGIIDNRMRLNTKYHAYAADTTLPIVTHPDDPVIPDVEERRLSFEETIGLYGYRMQLTYTGLDNVDQFLQLQLIGALDQQRDWPTVSSALQLWHVPGTPGTAVPGNLNVLWWYPSQATGVIDRDVKDADYLIYACWFPFLFESASSLAHPNIRVTVNFPEGIEVNSFENHILFLRHQSAVDSGWSYIQHTGSKTFPINQMAAATNGTGKGQSLVTPFPQMVDNETGITLGIIPNKVYDTNSLSGNAFTLSSETWIFNGCNVTDAGDPQIPTGGWFIVYVQRPYIISRIDWPTPPPTTRPPETTRPDFTTPLYTYDLSPLETNQINQIRLQNEQLQVEYAQLQGINYICNKLDAIYRQMVANGEIPVNLIPASTLPRDSNIEAFIQGQTSYTLAQLPPDEYFEKAETLTDLMREFTDRFGWFYIIGMFSLGIGVACWIIFRGRG